MRQMIILRSVTNRAKAYADRFYKRAAYFASDTEALDALKRGERPWMMIVNGGHNLNLGALAMGKGYSVKTKGVP